MPELKLNAEAVARVGTRPAGRAIALEQTAARVTLAPDANRISPAAVTAAAAKATPPDEAMLRKLLLATPPFGFPAPQGGGPGVDPMEVGGGQPIKNPYTLDPAPLTLQPYPGLAGAWQGSGKYTWTGENLMGGARTEQGDFSFTYDPQRRIEAGGVDAMGPNPILTLRVAPQGGAAGLGGLA